MTKIIVITWESGVMCYIPKDEKATEYIVERFDSIKEMTIIDPARPQDSAQVESEWTSRQENLLKCISELDLSLRAENALQNESITTVGDLARCTEQELLKMKSFGRKTVNEIKEALGDMGLSLKSQGYFNNNGERQ